MQAPTPDDDVPVAAASRPVGLWPESTRPGELRPSAFGSSLDIAVTGDVAPAGAGSVFDVCHVGVVLRALLFVHGVLALGAVFTATSPQAWLAAVAAGAAIALPGVLLWLICACLAKRWLVRLSDGAQRSAAIALGAAAGLAGAAIGSLSARLDPVATAPWLSPLLAPALAGAVFAALLFQWLHMRAQASLPARTAARLAELQARIQPHFLFNTLNSALTLVRLDPDRAEGVLEDLAELFRVALGDSGESAALKDEIELAQRYLAIEQIRFGDRIRVSWELDAAAERARVPPLLLQPLIENAVRHGVEPSDDGATIRVRTRVSHGRVVISIANTVPALPSRPGSGMALRNVRERLRLMHDVASQFEARRDGDVFRVQIVVPL